MIATASIACASALTSAYAPNIMALRATPTTLLSTTTRSLPPVALLDGAPPIASDLLGAISAFNSVGVGLLSSVLSATPLAPITEADLFEPVCSVFVLFAAAALINQVVIKAVMQLVLGALLAPSGQSQGSGDIPSDRFSLGKRLGRGSYGEVFEGFAAGRDEPTAVIKSMEMGKGAADFALAELYMNRKLKICGQSKSMASFQGHYYEGSKLSLVYNYEGTLTLDAALSSKDFPWNVEEAIMGSSSGERSAGRKAAIIRKITAQLFGNLAGIHGWSIIHRDVKGANLILAEKERKFKLIDFGAACDLFTRTNYESTLQLLDPDYCPPEGTLWKISGGKQGGLDVGAGGKFDVYSAALLVMQMCFPSYRGNSGIKIFRKSLEANDGQLKRWREAVENAPQFQEGLSILDERGGFALLDACLKREPGSRISSAAAARSAFCL